MDKINSVLVDFDIKDDWEFLHGLRSTNEKWIVEKCVSNGTHKNFINNILRYLKYIFFPFKKFLKRKKYKNFIAWQQFYGIFLCFFLRFFHSHIDCNVIILNFIYKEKSGIKGKIYKKLIRYSLGAKQLRKIGVLSSYEINYYSDVFNIESKLFFFSHIGLDKKASFDIVKGDYWLSVGRSNRDYNFLLKCFEKLKDEKLIILSDTYKPKECPNNVEIIDNCFGKNYEKKIAESYAMIISLCDEPISSGQLVVNNAFVYNKPVIVTKNPGINDYVVNDDNGYLIDKTFESLSIAMSALKKTEIYDRIANSKIRYSEYEYGINVLKELEVE